MAWGVVGNTGDLRWTNPAAEHAKFSKSQGSYGEGDMPKPKDELVASMFSTLSRVLVKVYEGPRLLPRPAESGRARLPEASSKVKERPLSLWSVRVPHTHSANRSPTALLSTITASYPGCQELPRLLKFPAGNAHTLESVLSQNRGLLRHPSMSSESKV